GAPLAGDGAPLDGDAPDPSPEHAPTRAPDDGRPVVIIVHGRGELPGDSAAVTARWSRIVETRTSELAGTAVLRDDDVWVAWYADALDPLSSAVCTEVTASGGSASATGAQN